MRHLKSEGHKGDYSLVPIDDVTPARYARWFRGESGTHAGPGRTAVAGSLVIQKLKPREQVTQTWIKALERSPLKPVNAVNAFEPARHRA